MKQVYGYYNGKPYYSAEEYKYACRKRGPIENDADLLAFAEKVTWGWQDAGWKRSFETYYLSDYALSEPRQSLTNAEFKRLKELQKAAQEKVKAAEEARQWRKVGTTYWADNSVEEEWEDKDGNRKTIMVVGPHGDVC